jgi:hypothetical protein
MIPDPFAADEVRERVLDGWTASPVRFREDANAEEDHVLGSYRDRLIVELAQNAADAACRAQVRGRLLLALRELNGQAVLVAANTGSPLTASGVQALATLRASDKRDDDEAVGRFGVGFSTVLSVSDEPVVVSRTGGVRFSAADTRSLVTERAAVSPGLAEELARRDGHVPVLRLPFSAQGAPPVGYDTAVLLPLRDAAAEDLVVRLLDEVGDPLLLALPGLGEVVVELPDRSERRIVDVASRWHVVRRGGRFKSHVVADRPTEERRRTAWTLTWALPRQGTPPALLFAPTPTDEPLPWPALLIAPFPLDPGRRHVAPGQATDVLVEQAALAYADMLRAQARDGHPIWPLIPVGLAHGTLDGALRAALCTVLPDTPLLPAAGHDVHGLEPALLKPCDAVVLEPPAGADPVVVAGLAHTLSGLVLAPQSAGPVLDSLGVRRVALADVVEQLPTLPDAQAWYSLYAALAGLATDPLAREALAALPVPLADGRVVRGVRGLVLPVGSPDGCVASSEDVGDRFGDRFGEALTTLGVRVVVPEAVHPLLEHLGAVPLEARAALELPVVRAAARSYEDDDPEIVDAVLTVVAVAVAAGRLAPGELPWLGDLLLPDVDDDVSPAAVLALPGSFAADVFDLDDIALVAEDVVDRWGPDVLAAVGVLTSPALLRLADVPLAGPGADMVGHAEGEGPQPSDLDGWHDWVDEVVLRAVNSLVRSGAGHDAVIEVVLSELQAVRDLDAVLDEAWPRMLDHLAADPASRAALLTPARVVVRGPGVSGHFDVLSYSAWWLCRTLAGGPWADPDAEPALAALLPPPPDLLVALDPSLRRALGAVGSTTHLDAAAVEAVLAGMADPEVVMDAATAITLWRELTAIAVQVLADGTEVAPPAWVRVLDGPGTRVVRVRNAVVVDRPAWLQRTDLGGAVIAPDPDSAPALADLLDVPLAGDLALGKIEESGQLVPVPPAVRTLLPDGPSSWCEHEDLLVDGVDVDWWVEGHGPSALVHANTFEGLARGLAWAAGAWHRRLAVLEVLADPAALLGAVVDEAFASLPPTQP